jgi:DNA invertase Pin-like site-specific DNA recombinase
MPKRVAFYVRVSTDGQTVQNQLGKLRAVAKRHGWEVIKEYSDEGISGIKRREVSRQYDKYLTGGRVRWRKSGQRD